MNTPETFCTSLQFAHTFRREHSHVLSFIRKMHCSEDFRNNNFQEGSYLDRYARKQPMFNMTKTGFMFLAMELVGRKNGALREAIIREFDALEAITGLDSSDMFNKFLN